VCQHRLARLVPLELVRLEGEQVLADLDEAGIRQLQPVSKNQFIRMDQTLENGSITESGSATSGPFRRAVKSFSRW
jgi:hypothetical protein